MHYYYSIASGSSGNCALLVLEDKKILIDAGVSHRRLKIALTARGLSFCDIDAIFLTHEHIDHVKGVAMIAKKEQVPIYATHGTCRAICEKHSIDPSRFIAFIGNAGFEFDQVRVQSFLTPHDAAESVGYVFETQGYRVGYATDLGFIPSPVRKILSGCSFVILESNHDVYMLQNGSYPYVTKQRVLGPHGHLSNADCAKFAVELVQNGAQQLLLAHLSEQNNETYLARQQTVDALHSYRLVCDVMVATPAEMDTPIYLKEANICSAYKSYA